MRMGAASGGDALVCAEALNALVTAIRPMASCFEGNERIDFIAKHLAASTIRRSVIDEQETRNNREQEKDERPCRNRQTQNQIDLVALSATFERAAKHLKKRQGFEHVSNAHAAARELISRHRLNVEMPRSEHRACAACEER